MKKSAAALALAAMLGVAALSPSTGEAWWGDPYYGGYYPPYYGGYYPYGGYPYGGWGYPYGGYPYGGYGYPYYGGPYYGGGPWNSGWAPWNWF